MKKTLLTLLAVCSFTLQAQVLIDNTATPQTEPNTGAILELNSTDKGLLLPRIEGESEALKQEGMLYYDKFGKCFKAWDGTAWQVLGTACISATEYTVSISDADPASVDEGLTQNFTVSLDQAVVAGTTVSVDYATVDGTAVSTQDYTAASGTVSFIEGEQSKTITIQTTDDQEADDNYSENYTVEISNPTWTGHANVGLGTAVGTGNIIDLQSSVLNFTEDLENQTLPGSYSSFTFSGPDGTTWSATEARDDAGYEIGGINALMLRRSSDNSKLEITFPNGIIDINFDYRKAFTGSGNRGFTVSKLVGTVETLLFTSPDFGGASGQDDTIHNTGSINVNETGSVTLIIKNTTSNQMNIDNFAWIR